MNEKELNEKELNEKELHEEELNEKKEKERKIRILDGIIVAIFAVIIILVTVFAINGGYYVDFETYSDVTIERQKLNYGKKVAEPEVPVREGYVFKGWVTSEDESLAEEWDFAEDTIIGDITLYAVWEENTIEE